MRRWHGYLVLREQGRGRWLSDPVQRRRLVAALEMLAQPARADQPGERLAVRVCARRREALIEGSFSADMAGAQGLIAALAVRLSVAGEVLCRTLSARVLGQGGTYERSRRAALAYLARHQVEWEAEDEPAR